MDRTRAELRRHFQLLGDGAVSFDNPVKRYQQKLIAEQTGDPVEKRLLALEDQLAALRREAQETSRVAVSRLAPLASRFAPRNAKSLNRLNDEIVAVLSGNRFRLIFDPSLDRSKEVTFLMDGSIGEGRNHNEFSWRVSDGRLEILEENNAVHSRFIFIGESKSFYHTNDPDTRSIRGQSIVRA